MLPAYKFAYTSNLLQNQKKKGGGVDYARLNT